MVNIRIKLIAADNLLEWWIDLSVVSHVNVIASSYIAYIHSGVVPAAMVTHCCFFVDSCNVYVLSCDG